MANVRHIIKDGKAVAIHKTVVHIFTISDMGVNDPIIAAGLPLKEWEDSDVGKFILENSIDTPTWHQYQNSTTMDYQFAIVAELEEKKLSEFYLKFDKPQIRHYNSF